MSSEIYQKLLSIPPHEFEEFLAIVWRLRGYEVATTSGSGDRGIDFIAARDGNVELVQVKQYSKSNKISSGEVRKYATLYLQEEDIDEVIIATTSEPTSPAASLAADLEVTIYASDTLVSLVSATGAYDILTDFSSSTSELTSSNSCSASRHAHSTSSDRLVSIPEIPTDASSDLSVMAKYEAKLTKCFSPLLKEISDIFGSEAANAAHEFIFDGESCGNEEYLWQYLNHRSNLIELINWTRELANCYHRIEELVGPKLDVEYTEAVRDAGATIQSISDGLEERVQQEDIVVNHLLETNVQIKPGEQSVSDLGGPDLNPQSFDVEECGEDIEQIGAITATIRPHVEKLRVVKESLRRHRGIR